MQQLKAQIVKGRQHLETAIEETVTKARETAKSEYQTALRKEDSLKEVLRLQKTEAMALNSNAVEYNNLKVEVSTKRTLMDSLLKRQSETEISARLAGSRESNIRVVDRALPPGARFRPSYRRNVSMGLMLGMALGLGLAFFLEYLDRTIRNPEQVERHLGLPALGLIPAVGEAGRARYGYYGYGYNRRRRKKAAEGVPEAKPGEKVSIELLPHIYPRSVAAEAYRAFRAALLLSRAGGVKCFVISSGLAGEGKTSTAVNLAIVLGQLGKRVLLIDADLHKPRMHKVLKLTNRVGLVSVLAESVEPAKAIQGTNIPFLWALTSGPNSPNPSGLLASEAMSRLLQLAQQHYDYVVIDSPPVQPVADALLIGVQTDGVVLTVKGGKTARDQVARVRDKLQRAGVRILGVLINNLAEDASDYVGRRYYYYGSESGYGYGEEPGKASEAIPKVAQGTPS
jgi:capsular exopolysaccharide synthesis family protein